MKERILFFDILRIIAVFLIVFAHIASSYSWYIGDLIGNHGIEGFQIPLTGIMIGFGQLAVYSVYLLIFISGAVLEYSHPNVKLNISDIWNFYKKRLIRIYPAAWMSILLAIMVQPTIIFQINLQDSILSVLGFATFFGNLYQQYNPVMWFIGVIICLYLLYPFLTRFVDQYSYFALFTLIAISILSSHIIILYNFGTSALIYPTRWFPLCNLGFFCFGIFIVKKGFFFKTINKNKLIAYLAKLSFYLFLFHYPLLYLTNTNLGEYIMFTILISIAAMVLDQQIQNKLRFIYT